MITERAVRKEFTVFDRLFLIAFFVTWTLLDLPFWIAKRLGLPVREIGER